MTSTTIDDRRERYLRLREHMSQAEARVAVGIGRTTAFRYDRDAGIGSKPKGPERPKAQDAPHGPARPTPFDDQLDHDRRAALPRDLGEPPDHLEAPGEPAADAACTMAAPARDPRARRRWRQRRAGSGLRSAPGM